MSLQILSYTKVVKWEATHDVATTLFVGLLEEINIKENEFWESKEPDFHDLPQILFDTSFAE